MTDEEKILGFAGLEHKVVTYTTTGGTPVIDRSYWLAPDGEIFHEEPDTTDLTWLFKWCVPGLRHRGYTIEFFIPATGKSTVTISALAGSKARGCLSGTTDTAGEALRGAILTLIGEGDG